MHWPSICMRTRVARRPELMLVVIRAALPVVMMSSTPSSRRSNRCDAILITSKQGCLHRKPCFFARSKSAAAFPASQLRIVLLHHARAPARRHNHTGSELHSTHRISSPSGGSSATTRTSLHFKSKLVSQFSRLSRFDYEHKHRFTEHEYELDRKTDQPEILCAPANCSLKGSHEKLLVKKRESSLCAGVFRPHVNGIRAP